MMTYPLRKLVRFLTVIALFSLTARGAETWSRATAGEETLSLDGTWRFTTDAGKATGGKPADWDEIAVPGNWDIKPAYATHKGKGWYQREFTVPTGWPAGSRIRLCFDAVYHEAEVTLNGRVLGTHIGGYTPFEFDVTDVVVRGGANTLTVRADNSYRRGAWWAWGGISRSVTLRANEDVRIVYQHIRTEPDLASGAARVVIKSKLSNSGSKAVAAKLTSSLTSLGVVLDRAAALERPLVFTVPVVQVSVPAGGTAEATTEIVLDAAQVKLWHFDHPNLYASHLTLTVDGAVRHARRDRFGIRKVEFKSDGMYLNGERIRVPGFNRVSDSNTTGNTEPDELVRRDVDLMKSASAVFSRLMHSPQAPNLQDYMDERGLMTVAEIPVWGQGDPQVVADNPTTKRWLREMVERDYNHPSIVGWSTGNEIVNHFDYVRTMNDYVRRELDPHRMVGYASYTAFRGDASPETDGVTHSDLAMLNIYSGKAQDFLNLIWTVRRRWPEKSIFLSEFGVGQIGTGDAAKVPNFNAIWAALGKETYVIGGALWTFNDYRSDYKGTPPSGNREWGVVDVNRNLKPGYAEVRRAFAPVRSVEFTKSKIRVVPRALNELPSYTLKGYSLKWTSRAAAGDSAQGGEIKLPDIKPGAEALEFSFEAIEPAGVKLVSPTGYDVLDATQTP
jgi:hypothetical protein